MKARILLLKVIGGFFLVATSLWGSTSIPRHSFHGAGGRLPCRHILTLDEVCERAGSGSIFAHVFKDTEASYGLTVDEFRQLPVTYRRRIIKFQKSCSLRTIKEIKEFLYQFSQAMPPYRHYIVEQIFFKAIGFIIRNSDVRYNSKICELLEAIECEFREVGEYVFPHPRYPLFAGVMPWHDAPLSDCIEKGDMDALVEVLEHCLAIDPIHNVSSGDTAGLFEIYRQAAQNKGIWNGEIAALFQGLAEKYSLQRSPLLGVHRVSGIMD
jgi:hypothetical protein